MDPLPYIFLETLPPISPFGACFCYNNHKFSQFGKKTLPNTENSGGRVAPPPPYRFFGTLPPIFPKTGYFCYNNRKLRRNSRKTLPKTKNAGGRVGPPPPIKIEKLYPRFHQHPYFNKIRTEHASKIAKKCRLNLII